MTRQLSLAVVGADHANKGKSPARRFEIVLCHRGEPVELRLEPKNPADPNAVAVFSERGVQLGYLTAERAPWIGGMMRQGREIAAVFQEPTRWGCAVRVAFDGELPVLPLVADRPAAVAADGDGGFWPDEIPPDD